MYINGESIDKITVLEREADPDKIRLWGEAVTAMLKGDTYKVFKRWKNLDEYEVVKLDGYGRNEYSLCFAIKPSWESYDVKHIVKITYPNCHRYEDARYLKKHYTEISVFANEIIANGLLPYNGKRIQRRTEEIEVPQLAYLMMCLNEVNEELGDERNCDRYALGMRRAYLDSVDHMVKKLRGFKAFVRKDKDGIFKTYEVKTEWI